MRSRLFRLDPFNASEDAVLDASMSIVQALWAKGNPIFEAPTLSFGQPVAYLLASS